MFDNVKLQLSRQISHFKLSNRTHLHQNHKILDTDLDIVVECTLVDSDILYSEHILVYSLVERL